MLMRDKCTGKTRGPAKEETSCSEDWESVLSHLRAFSHFRCRIDGPTEIEKAIYKAIDESFGPEPSPYQEWLAKLRRNGLITW
jgi:hypothetical protein